MKPNFVAFMVQHFPEFFFVISPSENVARWDFKTAVLKQDENPVYFY